MNTDIQEIVSEIADIRANYGTDIVSPAESVPAWAFQRYERIRRARAVYERIATLLMAEDLLTEAEVRIAMHTVGRIEPTWDGWLTAVELIIGKGKPGQSRARILDGWLRRFHLADRSFSERISQGKPLPYPKK